MDRKLAELIVAVSLNDLKKTVQLPRLTDEDVAREYQRQWHREHRAKGERVPYVCRKSCELGRAGYIKSGSEFEATDRPAGKTLVFLTPMGSPVEIPTVEFDRLLKTGKIYPVI